MGWVDAAAESLLEPVTDPNARLLSALLEVNAAEGGVDEFAPLLAQLACSVSDADGAAIELVDGKDMLYIASTGMLAGSEGTRVSRDGSLSGLVIITATPQVSPDITRDTRVDRAACERLGIASMAILPIRHSGHTVAVLKVSAREAGGHAAVTRPAGVGSVGPDGARRSRAGSLRAAGDDAHCRLCKQVGASGG
jgi:hypothetical protein